MRIVAVLILVALTKVDHTQEVAEVETVALTQVAEEMSDEMRWADIQERRKMSRNSFVRSWKKHLII